MFNTVIVSSTIVCAPDIGESGVTCNAYMIVASTGVLRDSRLNGTCVKYHTMFCLRYNIKNNEFVYFYHFFCIYLENVKILYPCKNSINFFLVFNYLKPLLFN